MAHHLSWTTSGTVWATWRLTPLPYGRRPLKEKRAVRDLHRMLWRALQGEALALGVTVPTDPVAVVERMIDGVDLEQCPEWAAEAEASLDRLAELPLGERGFWLSVPLANHGMRRFSAPLAVGQRRVRDALDLPTGHPGREEITARLRQADQIQQVLPAPFHPTPVSVAEQVWLAAHAQRRGMLDLPPPAPGDTVAEQLLVTRSGAALPEPVLDEGAQSDRLDLRAAAEQLGIRSSVAALRAAAAEARHRANPLEQRVLKVTDPRAADLGQPPSYQCLMALADVPPGGMVFPGSEFLGALDDYGYDVDWAVRLRVNARDKVLVRNRRAVRDLNDQYEQREGQLTTGHHELDLAAELLTEYQALFAGDQLEVEVEHTVVLAVADVTAAAAQDKAKRLTGLLNSSDLKLERPVGAQEELWWAMQPGVPATRILRSFAQFTSSSHFAAAVPFTTTKLGGDRGPALALNTSTARYGVVHIDPAGYPLLDKSGSISCCAELGGGKTVAIQTVCSALVDMGGQMMAIDKSADGEYARFAAAFGAPTVVDTETPAWSMDPLRLFGPLEGARVAQSFLTQLLNVSPQEVRGVTLAQVLHADYLKARRLRGLGDVIDHLLGGCDLDEAKALGQLMRNFARIDLGRVVFDQSLPPVDLASALIVWRTHRMEQPTREEIELQHLYRNLPLEKVFGRAYYSLLVASARRAAFADRSRPSALVCDEAYDIFSNPENARDLEHFVRQGRRPKALLIVGSHDPDNDFGSETLRSLIPTRVVLRQTDPALAAASVRYLGIDESDPEFAVMLEQLMKDTSPVIPDVGVPVERRGECFIRDAFGGIGPAKILTPAVPARHAAVLSTPPKSKTSTR